jgi:hypothetical protein
MKINFKKVLLRLPAQLELDVLAWMARHPEATTFTQAILRLIAHGLKQQEKEK